MNTERQISTFTRGLCLHAAVSLLLFSVLSAPHRVHHFFDQFTSPQATKLATASVRDHGDHQQDHSPVPAPASQQTDCAILTATQIAHALAASSFDLTIFTAAVEHTQRDSTYSTFSFNPSPRSQRAPPLV
jgi:hypothetical protein